MDCFNLRSCLLPSYLGGLDRLLVSGVLEELKEAIFFFFLRFCRNASSTDGIDEPIETASPDRTLGSRDPKGIRFVMMTVPLLLSEEKKGASVESQQYQLLRRRRRLCASTG